MGARAKTYTSSQIMSPIPRRGITADTLNNGLILGGGIWHVTATSQFTRGSKQLRTCILFKCIDFRLLVTFFNLFVFHLQVNVVGALLLNTSLLPDSWYCRLITVTDQCRSLNLLTTENDGVFWVLTDYWLFVRLMPRDFYFRMSVFTVRTGGLWNIFPR